MAIPVEILAVERPKNTRVKKSGDRYLVIKRTCKRVNGKPTPVDLGTIGEIIDGKYMQIREQPRRKSSEIDIKDYGQIMLCHKAAGNLFKDLTDIFEISAAKRLYVIALLRAAEPDIKNRDIQIAYETSYISEVFPGISLSENTLSSFLEKTGMAYRYIHQFMEMRIELARGRKLVVDGTLKDNNSDSNSFSEYSRKGKTKGSKDVSLMYAFDLESKEPVAVKPYPGNMLDLTAVKDFVKEFPAISGILVMDKGFYSKNAIAEVRKMENVTFIISLKSSSAIIKDNHMNTGIVSPLNGYREATVLFKKKKISNECYLYAFRNPKLAGEQEAGFVSYSQKKGSFSEEKLQSKADEFGVIVFESNADMTPLEVFTAYAQRWQIEVMFQLYKGIVDMDTVNVQGDYRLYASEFINFLSTIIEFRVKSLLASTVLETKGMTHSKTPIKVSEKLSYRQVFRYLAKCKRVRVGSSDQWVPNIVVKYIDELIAALGV